MRFHQVAPFALAGIQLNKRLLEQQDLSAYFYQSGPATARETQRKAAQRSQVRRYLFASCAITACCATRENTIFISQADRQTIKFWFDSVVDRSN